MRIIAGQHRGRKLLPPDDTGATRPITDRVKQSLFDILTPLLPDAIVYDCFAGTGSMGLECLSRGASHATFFESDRAALARLRRNIDALKVRERATVIPSDLFRWFGERSVGSASADRLFFGAASNRSAEADPTPRVDLIFLDPPYRFLRTRPTDLQRLAERLAIHHLAPTGTVIFRHDAADRLDLPPLKPQDTRTYGGMTLELLTPDTPARFLSNLPPPAS